MVVLAYGLVLLVVAVLGAEILKRLGVSVGDRLADWLFPSGRPSSYAWAQRIVRLAAVIAPDGGRAATAAEEAYTEIEDASVLAVKRHTLWIVSGGQTRQAVLRRNAYRPMSTASVVLRLSIDSRILSVAMSTARYAPFLCALIALLFAIEVLGSAAGIGWLIDAAGAPQLPLGPMTLDLESLGFLTVLLASAWAIARRHHSTRLPSKASVSSNPLLGFSKA